ncbi:MAG: DNA-directed RNA polymerase subunit H [Candidatus Syntropharchaeia archaeon]
MRLMDHEMVPEHVLLSEEEAEEVLRRYDIKKEQLPKIKASDPIAREIGAKPGDIVKIIRKSQTAGRSISYRLTI